MDTVKIKGVTYIITKYANADMEEDVTTGTNFVTGLGYRKGDASQSPVAIVWKLDGDLTSEDASDWRRDWDTADATIELEGF